jgi:hypothetical protein
VAFIQARPHFALTGNYAFQDNPRSTAIKLVAEANGLKLDIVEQNDTGASAPADYKLINGLGKVPSFVGADGYILSECIAIAIYSTSYTLSHRGNASHYKDENYFNSYPCLNHHLLTIIHTLSFFKLSPDFYTILFGKSHS